MLELVPARAHQPMFSKLQDHQALSLWLRCRPADLRSLVIDPTPYYRPMQVTRRRGSKRPRTVYEIRDPLRRVHRTIALAIKPHLAALADHVQGFMNDRSAITNARVHCQQAKYVVTVDLEDFFGSIDVERVRQVFEQLGTASQVALTLARLCTFNQALPQGGRCSPALANLVATALDASMLTNTRGWTYTRYVDDLAFSGDEVPTLEELVARTSNHGFRVRRDSFRLRAHGAGQYVTGLCVEHETPRIPRHLRRRVARYFYWANAFDPVSAAGRTLGRRRGLGDRAHVELYLEGLIAWVTPIEPNLAAEWRAQLTKVMARPSAESETRQ
jgi:RNA-directed DNA polymerase